MNHTGMWDVDVQVIYASTLQLKWNLEERGGCGANIRGHNYVFLLQPAGYLLEDIHSYIDQERPKEHDVVII